MNYWTLALGDAEVTGTCASHVTGISAPHPRKEVSPVVMAAAMSQEREEDAVLDALFHSKQVGIALGDQPSIVVRPRPHGISRPR